MISPLLLLQVALLASAENARRWASGHLFDQGGTLLLWAAALAMSQLVTGPPAVVLSALYPAVRRQRPWTI